MKTYLYTLYIGMLISNAILQAKVGCMDNSWHLQKKYDAKEYHYVACNCPCTSTIANRNQCLCCNHYHDAQPWIIITSSTQDPSLKRTTVKQPPQAHVALKKLVIAYKRTKK